MMASVSRAPKKALQIGWRRGLSFAVDNSCAIQHSRARLQICRFFRFGYQKGRRKPTLLLESLSRLTVTPSMGRCESLHECGSPGFGLP